MKQTAETSLDSTPCEFLSSVAKAYITNDGNDLSDYCFVFPNKRSCTFFLKKLSDNLDDCALLAPEVIDISEFMHRIANREAATRIEMILRLYNSYLEVKGSSDSEETDILDFDRFASWGEVLLEDFNEVDKYDVNSAALFKNIKDFHDISSSFLTKEQCDIIERYFGYRPGYENAERFWINVGKEEEQSKVRRSFIRLWSTLSPLYESFHKNLESDNLAMPGTIFREAMHKVLDSGVESLPWPRVVIVGFNMLSTTEARLFAKLRDTSCNDGRKYAEFFWDATGPVLSDRSSKSTAARAINRNIKNFPSPEWAAPFIKKSDIDRLPETITISAAPSNVAQVKIASMTISDWIKESEQKNSSTHTKSTIDEARAAIIIPDENLLMPLLHSLPEELKAVNLTMGYSMRYTSVASFVYHLRRLQSRRRHNGDSIGYYHEDLRIFLSHPLVHVAIGTDTANSINGEISRLHLRVVSDEWLAEYSDTLAEILRPIPSDADIDTTINYIDHTLEVIDKSLWHGSDGLRTINTKIERAQIAIYRLALSRLLVSARQHCINMHFISVFHLVDRMLSGEKVNFEGEPLEGLQVMGLLETRAIDFDRLVILSMNDKVMPRRSRKRTFIPDALRHDYGLPLSSQSEELFSYYFYRLISRARNVTLIYDARAGEGMRSGGKSRFLLQLDMLHARNKMHKQSFSFMLDSQQAYPQSVKKTPEIMELLNTYLREDNGRNLSASALMNYCACPIKFYYKNVRGIGDDAEPQDFIDPITQGQIMHTAMLNLYFPEDKQAKYLTPDNRIKLSNVDLHNIMENEELLRQTLHRAVNKEHYHLADDLLDTPLTGTVELVAQRLQKQLKDIVTYDFHHAPLILVGGELAGNTRWKVGDCPEVNMRYAFDRVDIADGKFRIVDYKTGSSHVNAADIDDIFNGEYSAKYLIQLLIYAELLNKRVSDEEKKSAGDIAMQIYDVNEIGNSGAVTPKFGKRELKYHTEIRDEFLKKMESIFKDIFNPEKPFEPTTNEQNCSFCNLKSLCGKE